MLSKLKREQLNKRDYKNDFLLLFLNWLPKIARITMQSMGPMWQIASFPDNGFGVVK